VPRPGENKRDADLRRMIQHGIDNGMSMAATEREFGGEGGHLSLFSQLHVGVEFYMYWTSGYMSDMSCSLCFQSLQLKLRERVMFGAVQLDGFYT
jgi:hypothetical protein